MSSPEGTCLPSAGSAPLCATPSPRALASSSAPSIMPPSTSATSCWPRASCPLTLSQVQAAHSRGTKTKTTPEARAWGERGPHPAVLGNLGGSSWRGQATHLPSAPRKLGLSGLHARHGVFWPRCRREARDGAGTRRRPGHLHYGASELPVGCAFQLVSHQGWGPGPDVDAARRRARADPGTVPSGPWRRPPRCPLSTAQPTTR